MCGTPSGYTSGLMLGGERKVGGVRSCSTVRLTWGFLSTHWFCHLTQEETSRLQHTPPMSTPDTPKIHTPRCMNMPPSCRISGDAKCMTNPITSSKLGHFESKEVLLITVPANRWKLDVCHLPCWTNFCHLPPAEEAVRPQDIEERGQAPSILKGGRLEPGFMWLGELKLAVLSPGSTHPAERAFFPLP